MDTPKTPDQDLKKNCINVWCYNRKKSGMTISTWCCYFSYRSLLFMSHETNYGEYYESGKHTSTRIYGAYYQSVPETVDWVIYCCIFEISDCLLTYTRCCWICYNFRELQVYLNRVHTRRKFELRHRSILQILPVLISWASHKTWYPPSHQVKLFLMKSKSV